MPVVKMVADRKQKNRNATACKTNEFIQFGENKQPSLFVFEFESDDKLHDSTWTCGLIFNIG